MSSLALSTFTHADPGRLRRALGDRLGCTLSLASQISKTAGRPDSDEKSDFEYGADDFIDMGGALLAAGKLPQIKVDGPFGAPAEDVFKSEGEPSCGEAGEARADLVAEQSRSSSVPALASRPSRPSSRTSGRSLGTRSATPS